jgi:hypothetical protein
MVPPWIDRTLGTKNKSNAVNAAACSGFSEISCAISVPGR